MNLRRLGLLLFLAVLAGGGAFALWWSAAHNEAAAPHGRLEAESSPQLTWRTSTPAERRAAIQSIREQIAAFGKRDWKRASFYQSEGLRRNFASPERFGAMMTRGYPSFMRVKAIQFGEAESTVDGDAVRMPITLTDKAGKSMGATYMMVREGGVFKVAGVQGGTGDPLPGEEIL